jgi:hypothetical protein
MAFFAQAKAKPSLGELLGGGIGKGLATGLERRASLAEKLALQQQQMEFKAQEGLTPYQAISSELREKEQQRKIQGGVSQTLLKLAEEGVIQEQNIIPMSKGVSDLIRRGMDPASALEQGVTDFQFQSSAIDDLDIGKYKASKAKSLKEGIISSLQAENIKNPTLINRTLKAKNWPTKERQDILKSLKGKVVAPSAKVTEKAEAKMPSPTTNKGKIIRDTDTGKRYRSDGTKWVEIK